MLEEIRCHRDAGYTFGRQRFGRRTDRMNTPSVGPVLNALRRQRFGRLLRDAHILRAVGGCSTPYGVRGLVGGQRARFIRSIPRVLNALRRQRFGRSLVRLMVSCWIVLNALRRQRFGRTFHRCRPLGNNRRAQRLTASEVWSERARCRK